jgi:uncharacterized protein YndB with AHSA1/START domain
METSARHHQDGVFVISRVFDAPLDKVWQAWTDPRDIEAWMAPKGASSKMIRHDLRAGGELLSYIKMPAGQEMWGRHQYRTVEPKSRLVWVHSFSDAQGGLARHPFSATWPLELLTTVTFKPQDGRTRLTLTWEPIGATEAELETFADAMEGMKGGWGGSFDQLAQHLAGTAKNPD